MVYIYNVGGYKPKGYNIAKLYDVNSKDGEVEIKAGSITIKVRPNNLAPIASEIEQEKIAELTQESMAKFMYGNYLLFQDLYNENTENEKEAIKALEGSLEKLSVKNGRDEYSLRRMLANAYIYYALKLDGEENMKSPKVFLSEGKAEIDWTTTKTSIDYQIKAVKELQKALSILKNLKDLTEAERQEMSTLEETLGQILHSKIGT